MGGLYVEPKILQFIPQRRKSIWNVFAKLKLSPTHSHLDSTVCSETGTQLNSNGSEWLKRSLREDKTPAGLGQREEENEDDSLHSESGLEWDNFFVSSLPSHLSSWTLVKEKKEWKD